MTGWLGEAYPWVKAAHVIFVIFWMAGMLMLPRYLVYHQEALGTPGEDPARWAERENKLRRIILNPSMIAVWALGLMLAANLGLFDGQSGLGWLHAKLALVLLLSGYHGWLIGYAKRLQRGVVALSGRRLRLLNEIPSVIAIAVVILVIVRPF